MSDKDWRKLRGYNVEFSVQDFSKKRKVWVLRELDSKRSLASWFVSRSKKGFEGGLKKLNLFLEGNPLLRKYSRLKVY